MSYWSFLWIAVRTGIFMLMIYYVLASIIDLYVPEGEVGWRAILGLIAIAISIYTGLVWGLKTHEAKRL